MAHFTFLKSIFRTTFLSFYQQMHWKLQIFQILMVKSALCWDLKCKTTRDNCMIDHVTSIIFSKMIDFQEKCLECFIN